MRHVDHKKILITGVSSGIGFAIAEDLLNRGYCVIGISRKMPSFNINDNFTWVQCDLVFDISEDLISKITKESLTDVIICATVSGMESVNDSENLSPDIVRKVNYYSQKFIIEKILEKYPNIHIYYLSSGLLERNIPVKGSELYVQTKRSMISFLKDLNLDVKIINPGLVNTPLFKSLKTMKSLELRERYQTALDNGILKSPSDFANEFYNIHFKKS